MGLHNRGAVPIMKTTKTKEFKEGVEAFKRGDAEDSCPYPSQTHGSTKRTDWYNGYLETQIGTRLAHVFKRANVSWP